jgi:hypothetical protein
MQVGAIARRYHATKPAHGRASHPHPCHSAIPRQASGANQSLVIAGKLHACSLGADELDSRQTRPLEHLTPAGQTGPERGCPVRSAPTRTARLHVRWGREDWRV